jgi:hypothetical protein
MFKNILIAALAVVLCAGALSSRPGEESFRSWYRQRAKFASVAAAAEGKRNVVQRIFKGGHVDSELDKCVYRDRLLWADVELNGKVICSGAFSRWVAYDDVSGALKAAKPEKG